MRKLAYLSQWLVAVRSLAARPLIPSGFAVVASTMVPAGSPATPLVRHLLDSFPERFPTVSSAKKACRRGLVLLDGEAGRTVHEAGAGAQIAVLARVTAGPAPGTGRRARAAPEEQLTVHYEDEHLAVVAKPAGVAVPELRTMLAASLAPSLAADFEPLWRPQHVHRLDKPTSGLLVAAKTGASLRALSAAFAARGVRKRYRAVVAGELGAPGAAELHSVRAPLSGQDAWTEWRAVARVAAPYDNAGAATLVDLWPYRPRSAPTPEQTSSRLSDGNICSSCKPASSLRCSHTCLAPGVGVRHTGRTHQLRRHMALLGHPILGDARYGPREAAAEGDEGQEEEEEGAEAGEQERGRLCLAAVEIDLAHPHTGKPLNVCTAEPEEWRIAVG